MTGWPLEPDDTYNRELLKAVGPPEWQNPKPARCYNLVVLGAGTAGLVAAAGAAGLGAKVALVERRLMGGDCLNFGCVPSKALIRAARAAAAVGEAEEFGVRAGAVEVDFAQVMARLRRLRADLSVHDGVTRFTALGVDVFLGEGRFTGRGTVAVAGEELNFRKAVIATGARPVDPPLPGLAETGYLTNETVFALTARPARLAVLGGGPLGCEMAQAFQRLGSQVTLFHKHPRIMNREDEDAAELVQRRFQLEGVNLLLGVRLVEVRRSAGGKVITYEQAGQTAAIEVDEMLAGAGRAPNVAGLDLEAAGIEYEARTGVRVNDRLQTTNRQVYAAGDVCLPFKFTHMADAAARLVIQNAFFGGRKKLSRLVVPWCTYTDPEVAHVGLSEEEAARQGVPVTVWRRDLAEVDRAVLDGETEGFVKILVRQGTDKIIGATIVARHAGEMISEVSAAMAGKLGLAGLAGVIHPYPTQAEAIRQVGDAYNRTRLTPWLAGLLRRYFAWRRS